MDWWHINSDMLTNHVREGKGLKELVRHLKPRYVMPSRATMTKCIENTLRRRYTKTSTQISGNIKRT